jgi:hypothetical protein
MTISTEPQPSVLAETSGAAIGREHRNDPVVASTGGPAGNARLTAWIGLALLVLFVVECATLLSLNSMIAVHIFVGALLVPLVVVKTATTGWRVFRYYSRSEHYLASGPPPLLLRLIGPFVVIGALAVFGTGLSLVALGNQASHHPLFSLFGFGMDPVGLHKIAFVFWFATTGLHVLGRLVPALQLSRLAPAPSGSAASVPGKGARTAFVALVLATGALTGFIVLHVSGGWSTGPWQHVYDGGR